MKRTDENEIDDYTRMKKLTLYGWLGIPTKPNYYKSVNLTVNYTIKRN